MAHIVEKTGLMLSLVQPSLAVQSSLALCAASQLPTNPRFQPAKYIMDHYQDFVAVSGKISLPAHRQTIGSLHTNTEKLLEKRREFSPRDYWPLPLIIAFWNGVVFWSLFYHDDHTYLPDDYFLPHLLHAFMGPILSAVVFVTVYKDLRKFYNKAEQELRTYLNSVPVETLSEIAVEFARLRGDEVPLFVHDTELVRGFPIEPPPDK